MQDSDFIPGTSERKVAKNIVYRPTSLWHTYTIYEAHPQRFQDKEHLAPYTVTHRLYWNKKTDKSVSALLSYPNTMGCCDEYFWETYSTREDGDIERYTGKDAEMKMETDIIKYLS